MPACLPHVCIIAPRALRHLYLSGHVKSTLWIGGNQIGWLARIIENKTENFQIKSCTTCVQGLKAVYCSTDRHHHHSSVYTTDLLAVVYLSSPWRGSIFLSEGPSHAAAVVVVLVATQRSVAPSSARAGKGAFYRTHKNTSCHSPVSTPCSHLHLNLMFSRLRSPAYPCHAMPRLTLKWQ